MATEKDKSAPKLIQSSIQSAIFNFVMTLIAQYRQTMPAQQAADRTSLWLRSLADKIDEQAAEQAKQDEKINNLLQQTEREQ